MSHPPRLSRAAPFVCFASLLFSATLRAQAPPTASQPWPIPDGAGARALSEGEAREPVSRERYDLPALIDLAQRNNPVTRVAWEAAREAAERIGIVKSSYLPQLSLQAVGGREHTPLPAPKNLVPEGYFVSDSRELIPALTIKWLLFDFGQRDAKLQAARSDLFVANVSFTGAHQKLAFTVTQAYFSLGATQGRLRAARQALDTALVSQDAAVAKRANGLATIVAVAQAERQSAQARYNLTQAQGAQATALSELIAALGVPADTQLEVVDSSEMALPSEPAQQVSAAIRTALTHRPDVIAALGTIDTAEASLRAERRSYYPVIEMGAHAFQNMGSVSSDGKPYSSVNKPGANILFSFSVPLFDGGERASRVAMAQAKVRQAEARLSSLRDEAANEVVKAHNDLVTSLAAYQAATAVAQASSVSYDAALRSFKQGLGTYTDLAAEESAVAQSQAQLEDARSAAHRAAAGLAFSMGTLQSAGADE